MTRAPDAPDQATGVALILVDADGENSIAVAGGANAALSPGRRPRVARATPSRRRRRRARRARDPDRDSDRGPPVAEGASPARPRSSTRRPPRGVDAPRPSRSADILTPNEGEARPARGPAGEPDGPRPPSCSAPLAGGGRVLDHASVRRGRDAGRSGRSGGDPGRRDVAVVDTVGAGDTLNGAPGGRARGRPARRGGVRVRAVTAGPWRPRGRARREGMPTARELEVALAAQAPPG